MKKITLFISVCSLLFCFILAAVLGWYGYFSSVLVQEKPVGPYLMVYQKHTGSPNGVGDTIAKIHQNLSVEFKVNSMVDFGLYYDDPKLVDPEKCRALIGCIIENDSEGDLHAISEKYIVATLPRGMAVVVDYPYRNKLSVLFGVLKGYPALLAFMKENNIPLKPVLELYDVDRKRVRYVLFTAFDTKFFESYLLLK